MGFFDRFRRPKPRVSLPTICYQLAYFVLPHYVYNSPGRIVELCSGSPNLSGPFFYLMACQALEVEPIIEDAKSFHWHKGEIGEGREYYLLEYPSPTPVDLSDMTPEQLLNSKNPPVLAPYFSVMVRSETAGMFEYYILGQAPMGGGTTLRSVLAEGQNCNHGPGPKPELDLFLEAISARIPS